MRARLLKYWERIRSSYWFLPSLMLAAAIALAFASLALDEVVPDWNVDEWWWAYTGGAEGASVILGTVAGSMITIAGVVFSLTLVALTLASSQFGPRLLRNFMRDTTNQAVLGTFVATFLYCLLVLRAIRRDAVDPFVPHLSVALGVLLALASVGVLIYFIHHIAVSIQADEVVAQVGAELTQGIDRLFPEEIGTGRSRHCPEPDVSLPEAFERDSCPVPARSDGYLQLIDAGALLATAAEADVLLRVERRPGHYVVAGMPLVLAWPRDRVADELAREICAAFVLGNQRTPVQDVEFAINQLVEIAVRALSPGVNEPFTAITCVDRIGSALCRLARRKIPSPYRRDEQGRLRVIAPLVTFPDVADAAFNQIRQNARTNAAVSIRLLDTIAVIAHAVDRTEDRGALRRHAAAIAHGARDGLPGDQDRRAVEERYEAACRWLR